jgi:hypothetical protein
LIEENVPAGAAGRRTHVRACNAEDLALALLQTATVLKLFNKKKMDHGWT